MVHFICLLETKPHVTPDKMETLMVETRIRLLKISEVAYLRVGKRIDAQHNPFGLFFSFDAENLDKLKTIQESPHYSQFEKMILEPNIAHIKSVEYEMEPGKDVRYS
ncbi:MAG: hypothetical protein ACAI35_10780 [Candidatus Methylacidiphilales bacterium]|nr:hypothetical protein [Candidatus Methylacidiphilales bacterium]